MSFSILYYLQKMLKNLFLIIAIFLFSAESALPHGPQRVYIANDDHTDYMWSADEETYRHAFLETLDYYLRLADSTAGELHEHQSRWNCDGTFWIWNFEHYRPSEEFARLVERVKDGHISSPMNTLVSCYGGMPAEAVLRGMYYAGRLERLYGIKFSMAEANENQTLPYGLASLWAGSGAKYSWRGICNCATRVPDPGTREHEIYWWAGPDSSRILLKWNSLTVSNRHIGGYAEARDPYAVVNYVTDEAESNGFQARYPYEIIGAFGKGWDDLMTITDDFIRAAKEKTTSERLVIVSNKEDFFRDFEASYGNMLPTVSASFGNEWDFLCASMAEVSARVKRAVESLRAAEALATLVSLKDQDFMDGRAAARERAWNDLGLYWEHSWTAGPGITAAERGDWERKTASEIENYVYTLQKDAALELAGMIRKSGAYSRFYAFNPLSWSRTDYADLAYSTDKPCQVIDLVTGEETPSQWISRNGQTFLRILAENVPPVGYKVFEIRPGQGSAFSPAAEVSDSIIENDFYRITLSSRGAITGLCDKTLKGREFALTIGGLSINDLGPGKGVLNLENEGPVSVTLAAKSPSPLRHTTRITLFRNSRRIEIANEIRQNFRDLASWGFAFRLSKPQVWHEEVGAVIRAGLLQEGGHYSPRNARYDWLTLNHFARISGADGTGVVLSNADCYFMRLGSSTVTYLDAETPLICVLAGGQVDSPDFGIPAQDGDSYFLQRFALATGESFSHARSMRFALEHQNPLVTAPVTGGESYPETYFSLVKIDNPEVLLWALKPAEEGIGHGIIARLWNFAESPARFSQALSTGPIAGAWNTTHIETNLEEAALSGGALEGALVPQQMKSFRLNP